MKCRRLLTTVLDHGDFDRRVTEDEHTAVRRSVPAINLIERAAPQRPYGQVEPERRARTNKQRREITRPARSTAGGRHVGYVTAALGSSSAAVAWTGCSIRARVGSATNVVLGSESVGTSCVSSVQGSPFLTVGCCIAALFGYLRSVPRHLGWRAPDRTSTS
jgi:hypothetical protein